jgi:hypothetical protein
MIAVGAAFVLLLMGWIFVVLRVDIGRTPRLRSRDRADAALQAAPPSLVDAASTVRRVDGKEASASHEQEHERLDEDAILQELLRELPTAERGERPEWKLKIGVNRKEDIFARGQAQTKAGSHRRDGKHTN